jgi:hypothetical protein
LKNKENILQKTGLKTGDFIITIISIAAVIFSINFIRQTGKGNPELVIDTPEGQYVYPLTKDRTVTIPGKIGDSVIQIKNGTACFLDSPCPNKLCVKSAPISKDSDWIACLPNQIFIRIERPGTSKQTDADSF